MSSLLRKLKDDILPFSLFCDRELLSSDAYIELIDSMLFHHIQDLEEFEEEAGVFKHFDRSVSLDSFWYHYMMGRVQEEHIRFEKLQGGVR